MLPFAATALLIVFFAATGKRMGLAFMVIPAVNIFYFSLSTEVFEFGRELPYDLYDEGRRQAYVYVEWMLLLHFSVSYLAFQFARVLFPVKVLKQEGSRDFNQLRLKQSLGPHWFIVSIMTVVFILLAVDVSYLIDRSSYVVPDSQHGWMRFADLFFLISSILTPFLKSKVLRFTSLVLVVLFFSMIGSRSAVVMIFIYIAVERFILGQKKPVFHIFLGLIACYLLAILLSLRPNNEGGLVSIIYMISSISFVSLLEFVSFGFNYMLNYSIAICAEMITAGYTEKEWFIYSILPLPSAFYDLTEGFDAANRFRVNIPYPGFGYAIAYLGPFIYLLAIFFTHLGIGLLRNLLSKRRDLIERLTFYSMLFLPVLFSLQYNLRTTSRIFYLFLFVYFVIAILRRVKIERTAPSVMLKRNESSCPH